MDYCFDDSGCNYWSCIRYSSNKFKSSALAQMGAIKMMKDIEELWKDKEFLSQSLTLKDVEDLVEYITPWLKDMELKFSWDYYINEMRLPSFIETTLQKMYEIVDGEYKEEYELYPKQQDFCSLWDIISEYHIGETIEHGDKIWELITDWILKIASKVLD